MLTNFPIFNNQFKQVDLIKKKKVCYDKVFNLKLKIVILNIHAHKNDYFL